MKNRLFALATGSVSSALLLASGIAMAQPAPAPMSDSATPPAVTTTTTESKTTAAPVAGQNSFTLAQVEKRLAKHGYTHVTDLKKDDKSVWRGQAMKAGKLVNVSVDYQGNITAE